MKRTLKYLGIAAASIVGVILLLDALITFDAGMRANERTAAINREEWRRERAKPCERLGGVPIFSAWSGDLKECQFPLKVTP